MIPAALSIGLSGVLAALIIFAGIVATKRFWGTRDYLAIAFGLATLGVASMVAFVAYWMHPIAGVIASVAILGGSVGVLVARSAWRYWRTALPLFLLSVGLLLVYLGVLYLWDFPNGAFSLAAQRFSSNSMPTDNRIPYLFSEAIATGSSTHPLIGDWNGSDRPPLQAGFLLIVRTVAAPIAGATSGVFGASVVAQLLWIPALFAAVRALGASKTAAVTGVLMAAVTGTTILNTLYTWPKMMSAAYVLISAVFLVDAIRRPSVFRRNFALAVLMFVLAALSHGAAAFAVPIVVALGLAAYRGHSRSEIVRATAIAAGVGLVAYLPWVLYQRLADPPGDRLLRWHLAGVVGPGDPRSLPRTFLDQYGSLTPGEWIQGRLANIQAIVHLNPFNGISCLCADDIDSRRAEEFFTSSAALVFALPALLVILAIILVRVARRRGLLAHDRPLLFIVVASLASILLWVLLMFTPGSTVVHQGSQVWLLLLLAAPAVWLARRHTRLALALVVVQALWTAVFYLPAGTGGEGLSAAALAVAVAGVLVTVGASLVILRRGRGARRAPIAAG